MSENCLKTTSYKYPFMLEVEATSRCTVNPPCPMCARVLRVFSKTPEKDMPVEIIDWLKRNLYCFFFKFFRNKNLNN